MPNRSALLGHTFLERGEQFHPSPMTLTAKRYEFQRWNGLHRQLSYHSIPMLGFVAFGTEEGSDAHRPTAAMRHALMTSRLQREVSVAVGASCGLSSAPPAGAAELAPASARCMDCFACLQARSFRREAPTLWRFVRHRKIGIYVAVPGCGRKGMRDGLRYGR